MFAHLKAKLNIEVVGIFLNKLQIQSAACIYAPKTEEPRIFNANPRNVQRKRQKLITKHDNSFTHKENRYRHTIAIAKPCNASPVEHPGMHS